MQPAGDDFLSLFMCTAAVAPSRIFARFGAGTLTFGALDRHSARICAWLGERGVAPGDRVALMVHNGPSALAFLFALARSGAIWVPINVRSRGDTLAYILSHAEPRLVIADDDLVPTVKSCRATLAEG